MRAENEFRAPQFDRTTGGKGPDRPLVELELEAETRLVRRLHALLAAELAAASAQARGGLAAPTGTRGSAPSPRPTSSPASARPSRRRRRGWAAGRWP